MVFYINNRGEIKDINTTKSIRLKPVIVADDENPCLHWSEAKILCHRIEFYDSGKVKRFVPYVDSRIVEHIDKLGRGNETNASNITDTQIAVAETYEKTLATDTTVTDIQLAMTEIYEMMLGGN